jgi:type VI secretion system protein ImpH
MAPTRRPPAAGVAQALFAEPYRFDFFQAVRVLEALRPAAAPAGEGSRPADEAVRFRATPALSFAPSDIVGVAEGENGAPPEMTVAFLGLAGAGGPLPRPFSEWVLHQARAGDTGPRDFLDLFHHRLVSLMYRARARHRVSLARTPADETAPGRWLFSLMGLGTPGLRDRTAVPDRALLGYAALFAGEVRSGVGLERVLGAHFGVRARVVPFTGGWVPIEPDDWTRIGATGQNRMLGTDAVLGRRAWDPQAAFEVELGPLSLGEYVRFLPIGNAFAPLRALVRLWAGAGPAFTVRLLLRAAEVPPARRGLRVGAHLGWTSWLRTRPRGDEDADVRLDPLRSPSD